MQTIIEFSIFDNAYIISMFMLLNCSSIQTQFFKQKIDADGEDVFRSNFAFIDRHSKNQKFIFLFLVGYRPGVTSLRARNLRNFSHGAQCKVAMAANRS